jgi:sarcosine oxidase, subunit beta
MQNRRSTYSIWSLARHALSGHASRPFAWRAPDSRYDVVIVGGGGHRLVIAHFLARRHGLSSIVCSRKGGSATATLDATNIPVQ